MYITHVEDVKEYELKSNGMKNVKVKYLLHAGIGAKKIQLRLFTIDVNGHTPLERHEHEHEVFILKGKGIIRNGEKEYEIKPGDVIFIQSNELHQIVNIGNEPLQFLCTKETSEVPEVIIKDIEFMEVKSC
ncbi:MAG: cupin domain-containing protein [Candidatus Methanomethylicaceae archaeon]